MPLIKGMQALTLMGALMMVSLRHWTPQAWGASTGSTGRRQLSKTVGSGILGPHWSVELAVELSDWVSSGNSPVRYSPASVSVSGMSSAPESSPSGAAAAEALASGAEAGIPAAAGDVAGTPAAAGADLSGLRGSAAKAAAIIKGITENWYNIVSDVLCTQEFAARTCRGLLHDCRYPRVLFSIGSRDIVSLSCKRFTVRCDQHGSLVVAPLRNHFVWRLSYLVMGEANSGATIILFCCLKMSSVAASWILNSFAIAPSVSGLRYIAETSLSSSLCRSQDLQIAFWSLSRA